MKTANRLVYENIALSV